VTEFKGTSQLINPDSGGTINLSGTISGDSGKSINWTLNVAGKVYTGTGTSASVAWDGKDASGKVVEPGQYSATLNVQTDEGKCNDSKTANFDVVPPPDGQCGLYVDFGSSANVASGNLSHSQDLFSTRGSSLTTAMILNYNSFDPHNASLGMSWSHSYDISLKQNSGSVVLHEGNGKHKLYTFANGAYFSQPGDYVAFVKNGDGTFALTRKDGTRYTFGADGKVTAITDRNNNAINFVYSGGNLATVTDPAGRVTTLSYDDANHLNAVTDPAGNAYSFAYSGNTLSSVTYPDGGTWRYTYDANAFMLSKTDPLGNITSYAYDNQHRVVSSTDPEGKSRGVSYMPAGPDVTRTTTFTEKDGGVWEYTYNTQAGTLTSKTDPQGGVTSYIYAAAGNRTSTILPDGTTTSYTYDGQGNMSSTTDALGQTTSYTYNSFGQVLSITDPQESTTGYAYDAKGNLTATTDPTGATTKYEYDGKGNVTKVSNPLGQATTFVYDAKGNLASVTDPAGATTSYTYGAAGNMTSQTDANGATTSFEYNAKNQLVKVSDPQGNVTSYTYDVNDSKTSQIDANGNTTYFEYNYKGQLVKTTDALGNVTNYAYGGTGCASCGGGTDKLTSITDANGNTIRYEYNELGGKVREIDALGNAVSYTYDAKGNILTKADALGRVTTFVYDPLNHVKEQTDPAGGKILFEYSPKGQLTKVTDPIGVSTVYEYDTLGRNIRTSSPDAGTTTYTYNPDGTLKAKTDGNGTTVTYEYDTKGRLLAVKYTDAAQNIAYSYDTCTNGKGKVCSMTDPSGTTAYSYDSLGRIGTELKTIFGVIYTTGYSYDKAGNLASTTYPSGRTISYSRDKLNRTSGVTAKLKNMISLASSVTYDSMGNLMSLTYGNGLALSQGYDTANRVRSIIVPGIMNYAFSYDPVGNILAINDAMNTANAKSYAYDLLDHLSSATGPWGTLSWAYDGNGNCLSQKNGTSYNYKYDANRLASITNGHTTNYGYDNAGNTTSDGTREFIYNQNNRLIKAIENGKTVGEYTYNGKGERVTKKTGPAATNSASSQNTAYHYDLTGTLIEETAGDGKLLVDYVYLDGKPLAMIRKQGNNEETFYYHNDHLGTPKVMTDKLDKVVWNVDFDPFGNEVQTKGRQGSYIRSVENNLRLPGQYFDAETGLHYNYFRDYNPKIGRYFEADPIGLRGGVNLFVYTGNNTVNRVDPSGLAFFAKRALEGKPWIPGISNNPILDVFDAELSHEQLFFEDNDSPFNVGFFDDGTPHYNESSFGYNREPGYYDDCIMRKAYKNVTLKKYHLIFPLEMKYNCQNWADDVRNEYNKLKSQ